MTNFIELECACGCTEEDVQAKLFDGHKTIIQTKCTGCNRNHYLPSNDFRCKQFFK